MTTSLTATWKHADVTLNAGGATIEPVRLTLADGRVVEPFHRAPWIAEPGHRQPRILDHIRGLWPCVPFGAVPPALPDRWSVPAGPEEAAKTAADEPHGYGANADWTLATIDDGLEARLSYPIDRPIDRLVTRVGPLDDAAGIRVDLEVFARISHVTTPGLHPTFRVPATPGALRIRPGRFRHAMTYPVEVEPGVSLARPDTLFRDLGAVPLKTGETAPFDRLPFAQATEEIVTLLGTDGTLVLEDYENRVVYHLNWDAAALPHVLLWISNRGRTAAPWSGRNLCLGVEPVVSAFDLGPEVSATVNPITELALPSAVRIDPDRPWRAWWTLRAEPLAS